ncbi:MAG: hypothetical protein FWE36_00140 [Erysipelotrichales bacterium]|nr:hypothetical protein [Erysipelotrichales bacterium]
MALRRITFDGATVSSKDDADINFHLSGLVVAGIIQGLGEELSVTAGNNTINFGSGYVQIYGRRIFVERNTSISVSLDSTASGFIVIDLNLANNTVTLLRLEAPTTFPTLIQNNLHTTVGRFQFPIARYRKTATSLTLETNFARSMIRPYTGLILEAEQRMMDYIHENTGPLLINPTQVSGNRFFYNISLFPSNLFFCLFHVRLENFAVFTFSGRHLVSASMQTLSYTWLNQNFTLTIEYTFDQMILYSSNTSHRVSTVEIWR